MFKQQKSIAAIALLTSGYFFGTNFETNQCESQFKYPYFKTASRYSPKFDKRDKNGEDAHSISADQKMLCVCDGVGGWTTKDERPDLVSRHIAESVKSQFQNRESEKFDLREMLVHAARTNPHIGSTTAVITSFQGETDGKEAKLQTCNLGDSGYLIVRPENEYETIFRSKEQTWAFNAPEQCGTHCELPYGADRNSH